MFNLGEELVASYLEYIKGCDFIQKNLYTPDVQGEIDVVGINLKSKEIYVCEVAIHLTTGTTSKLVKLRLNRFCKSRVSSNLESSIL
jgi:Holliday junction resolvase-like predicted endonuclease